MSKILYVVVPCYNESEVFARTEKILSEKLLELVADGRISPESRILFVNDGSGDDTWEQMQAAFENDPAVCVMSLTRNRGHQNALLAGLEAAASRCDFSISIDADLQDDPGVFGEMIDKYEAGADIVYGVRSSRRSDSFFKRATAQGFYRLLDKMGAETVYNHADFRLMSRRAMEALMEFGEVNLFLRGIVPLIGYKTDAVTYERRPRAAGKTKYSLKKMLALAADGVTGFSVKPVRLIALSGAAVLLLSFIAFITGLILRLCGVLATSAMAVFSALFMLGGFQILCLGIVGEYSAKTYMEAKARPRYFISELKIK